MITVYVQRAYVLFCCWHICIFFTAQIKRPIIIQNMTFKRENFLAGDSFHSKFSSQAPNILIKKIFPNPKPAVSIFKSSIFSKFQIFFSKLGKASFAKNTSILFFQTHFKHPATPLKSIFFAQKVDEKKINRDFIKGGRGGSPFYEVISQKIFFFTNEGFP